MTLVIPVFCAHQPFRLRPQGERASRSTPTPADLEDYYFDDALDRAIFLRVAETCYYPATRLMLALIRRHASREKPLRLAFGLSGTLLAQAQRYAPDLLDLWKELADTGCVEFTGETYYHSLSSLFDEARTDFHAQALLHRDVIQTLFGHKPTVFRNTEMLYNNSIASCVQEMGFAGMVTEGVDWLMAGWRSPDFLYSSLSGMPVLLRNYRLSDDIGYRFSDRSWNEQPLTAEKFVGWLTRDTNPVILLALDYETLGAHIGAETGIFEFMAALPERFAKVPHLEWATPSRAQASLRPVGQIDVPDYATISWADRERDTSAWLGNEMQQFCHEEMKRMAPMINATGDLDFVHVWRLMQATDHLRALSDKDTNRDAAAVEAFSRLQSALYDLKRRAEQFPAAVV